MSYGNRSTILGGIVAASALPESSVTSFFSGDSEEITAQMNNLLAVPSRDVFERLVAPLAKDRQLQEALLVELINYGNSLDLKAHMKMIFDHYGDNQSAGMARWLEAADTALTAIHSTQLQATAIYIYAQPFGINGPTRQQAINSTKAQLKLPQEVDFDAMLYKMCPRGIVYLAVQDETIRKALTAIDIGVLSQAEKKIKHVLKDQLKVLREQRKAVALNTGASLGQAGQGGVIDEDFDVTDYTNVLESNLAGRLSSDRGIKIEQMGDSELANYVLLNQQAYKQGIIPGAISPGKISACQDIVTMAVLQEAITKLAETQIFQLSTATTNPNIRAGLKQLGATPMAASLKAKADIVQQTNLISKTSFGEDAYNKFADLKYQLSGGPNDLKDDLQLAQHRAVLNLNPFEIELLGQTLSTMLACIRIRFQAVQDAKGELVPQEDIDSLQIIHRLSSYLPPDSLRFFDEITTYLAETIAKGHNEQLAIGYGLEEEQMTDAISGAFEQGKEIAKSVPMIAQDLQGSGNSSTIYKRFFDMVLISLANRNRVQRETIRRQIHRNAIFSSIEGENDEDMEIDKEEPMSMQMNEQLLQEKGQQEQQQVQEKTAQLLNS